MLAENVEKLNRRRETTDLRNLKVSRTRPTPKEALY
jgi:hypothetical protein